MRHSPNEDLNGYIRGAHMDGPEICEQFNFHIPGSSSTPDNVVWGWNDANALYCASCKRLATEHVVLKEPNIMLVSDFKPKHAVPPPGRGPRPTVAGDAMPANPAEVMLIGAREAEAAAYLNAGADGSGMLDDSNDPLAINARPKLANAPAAPPPLPPQPVARAAEQSFSASMSRTLREERSSIQGQQARAGNMMSYDDIMASTAGEHPPKPSPGEEGVQDAALAELLSRDASANEAFKREVERMVREASLKEELAARAKPRTSLATPPTAAAPLVLEAKDLSGATVPMDTFADTAALLNSVGLSQYRSVFEQEEMDPNTLIEVLQQQGKASLDEALKELGVKSMGHRLKMINALIVP